MSDAMDDVMRAAISAAIRDAADQAVDDQFRKVIAELNTGDVALVTVLAEALKEGDVTVADLQGLSEQEWMSLLATRRAA
jgi:hypothetical protein